MSELKNSEKEIKLCLKYECCNCGKIIIRPINFSEMFLQGSTRCECGNTIIFARIEVLD